MCSLIVLDPDYDPIRNNIVTVFNGRFSEIHLVFFFRTVRSLQLGGCKQIVELRKYYLVWLFYLAHIFSLIFVSHNLEISYVFLHLILKNCEKYCKIYNVVLFILDSNNLDVNFFVVHHTFAPLRLGFRFTAIFRVLHGVQH